MRKGLLLGLGTLLLQTTIARAQEEAPAARPAPEAKASLQVQTEDIAAPPTSAAASEAAAPAFLPAAETKESTPVQTEVIPAPSASTSDSASTAPAAGPAPEAKERLQIETEVIATPPTSGVPASAPAAPATLPAPTPGPAATLPAIMPIPSSGAVDGCCCCCPPVAPKQRFWVNAEYLMWWTKKSPIPVPLLTSTTDSPPIPGVSGVAGTPSPSTVVLLGNESLNSQMRSGGRFSSGLLLNDDATLGIDASYFFLYPSSVTKSASTYGTPGSLNLFLPFFDVSGANTITGHPGEAAINLAGPGIGTGGVFTERVTTSLQGADLNGYYRLSSSSGLLLDLLAGFRWVQLHEDLTYTAVTNGVAGTPNAGLAFNTSDDFNVRNNFYGGQLGLRGTYGLDGMVRGLYLNATAKVALGDMHQTAAVNGVLQTNLVSAFAAGLPPAFASAPLQTYPGGLFAQPSSIGRYSRDRFAVVPEVNVNLGYQVTDWARVYVGYTFLYLSNVARPGNLIDRNLNPTQTGLASAAQSAGVAGLIGLPVAPSGPAAPNFTFRDTSYWAQGINFGLQFSY